MSNYKLTIDEQQFDVEIGPIQGNLAEVTVNQVTYYVAIGAGGQPAAKPVIQAAAAPVASAPAAPQVQAPPKAKAVAAAAPKAAGSGVISAPIPGKIMFISVKVGDKVNAGQVVAVIEAMKMENDLMSPISGTVKDIRVGKDSEVNTGEVIMVIE
jgi:glutaconyl-CoA/methylmalonyl-CoA decarboxylase subunit gamma